jgi:hypothetical protein
MYRHWLCELTTRFVYLPTDLFPGGVQLALEVFYTFSWFLKRIHFSPRPSSNRILKEGSFKEKQFRETGSTHANAG